MTTLRVCASECPEVISVASSFLYKLKETQKHKYSLPHVLSIPSLLHPLSHFSLSLFLYKCASTSNAFRGKTVTPSLLYILYISLATSSSSTYSSSNHPLYKILHFFFFCGSGGSKAAKIASSNTFFNPFCKSKRGKREKENGRRLESE